jgi:methionyl-tRNA formyltransferase
LKISIIAKWFYARMTLMKTRIVFMGSPDFAVPTLTALLETYEVVGIVTQPDRPAGRGRRLTEPPIKIVAREHNVPFIQPRRLREPEPLAQLQAWAPDVIIVAAFGQILKPAVLDLPPHGSLNIHASLLPRWRGAAPISAAIRQGDEITGITIMKMDPGMDTGPILSQREEPIHPEDTTNSLSERLAHLGAELLLETLPGYLAGEIEPQAQDDQLATYAPLLKKEDGRLNFKEPAETLARQVRAFNPWPGTYTELAGQMFKIHRAHTAAAELLPVPSGSPGERTRIGELPAIWTSRGLLILDEVQPAGKKAQLGDVFLRGARSWD